MIVIALAVLPILAVLARKYGGSWFFPPAIYSVYWEGILLASLVIPISQDRLTTDSIIVFLVGIIITTITGIIVVRILKPRIKPKHVSEERLKAIQLFMISFSIIVLAMVPIFVATIQDMVYALRINSFAVGSRYVLGMPDQGGISRIFRAATSFAAILAFYSAWQYQGKRRDKVTLLLTVVAPILMSVLTFGRTPIFSIIVGVTGILLLRRSITVSKAVVILLITLVIALAIGTALNKGPEFGTGNSPLVAVARNIAIHFIGGPVGFGQVMENPELVGQKGLSFRFVTQPINSLGGRLDLPDNVLGYIGSDIGNVYTIYFAYWLDGGWFGIVLFSIMYGAVSSWIYMYAIKGNFIAGAAMGIVMSSLLYSAVTDIIFGSAVPWMLLLAIGFLLYYFRIPHHRKKPRIYPATIKRQGISTIK